MTFRDVITLSFTPRTSYVSSASKLVGQFFREHVRDAEVLDRCMVTAHELLENIVKYSVLGREVRIEAETVQLDADHLALRIRTQNDATPEHAADAARRLRALTEASDAIAHYDQLILETATRKDGSGLGLARIRAESDMAVSYEVQNNQVTIVAETGLTTRSKR